MDVRSIGILLIVVAVTIVTGAQLLIKSRLSIHGVMPLSTGEILTYLGSLARDWQLWIGSIGLLLGALAWYAGLSRIPLSLAYPMASLSYLLIFVGTIFVLGESFSWALLLGNLLIVSGVALVALWH